MLKTWIERLEHQANRLGDLEVYRYLHEGEADGRTSQISYAKLHQRARAIGAALMERGAQGERAALIFPPGLEFIEAFFGTLYAGAVPVPIEPPGLTGRDKFQARLNNVAVGADARLLLTESNSVSTMKKYATQSNLLLVDTSDVPDEASDLWFNPNQSPDDLALIQFTSGSTGKPRGACITHTNLTANCMAINEAGFCTEGGPHVGWMPHYHDMGLIGCMLSPLYFGTTSILMSPRSFARDSVRWLRAIDRFKATSSGGPGFAYARVLALTDEQQRQDLNLHSWQVAYCGAEPVRFETLKTFARAFESSGFREEAFLPCYGMSEATLFVSGQHGLRAQHDDSLSENNVNRLSMGTSFDETRIRIVSPQTSTTVDDGQTGEIWVKGPGIAKGYFGDKSPESPFDVELNGETGYFRTGDLGFVLNDELFICGRIKDLIITRGRNLHPEDIEQSVISAVPECIPGNVVSFWVDAATQWKTEGIAVLVGIRPGQLASSREVSLLEETKAAVISQVGVEPDIIALVSPRHIPKTGSGKVQRSVCRELWTSGQMPIIADLRKVHELTSTPYIDLASTLNGIENRNTNYRFDLDLDIEWSRIGEHGKFCSDQLLKIARVNVSALKAEPEAYRFFDWGMSLLICQQFISLEEAVLEWCDLLRDINTSSHRIELLDEEEAKHIELFKRCAKGLSEWYPGAAEKICDFKKNPTRVFLTQLLDRDRHENNTHFHYSVWLGILFFEEYSVWLDESLKSLGNDVQPAWAQLHTCHRREENHHLVTDRAYLNALEITGDERARWSRSCFSQILKTIINSSEALIALTADRYPHVQLRDEQTDLESTRAALDMLTSSQLKITRSMAPYAEGLIAPHNLATESGPKTHMDTKQLQLRIITMLTALTGMPAGSPALDVPFTDLGLDSMGHISLAARLEQHLKVPVDSNIAYVYPTIAELATHLISRSQTNQPPATITDRLGLRRFFNWQ